MKILIKLGFKKPRLIGGALLAALATEPSHCMVSQKMVPHWIDASVWTQAAGAGETFVYFDYVPGDVALGFPIKESAINALRANEDAVFGKINGNRVVIVREASSPSNTVDRHAVAAHESFHSAVQYETLHPRLDSVEFPGYPKLNEQATLYQLAKNLLVAIQSGKNKNVCTALQDVAVAPDSVRAYFLYRSYWEWPAEFYMRHSAFSRLSWDQYLSRRMEWSEGGGNPLYEVGVMALDQVDSKIGRTEWQKKYMAGEAPINLVAKVNNCERILPPSIQVKIASKNIFLDLGETE